MRIVVCIDNDKHTELFNFNSGDLISFDWDQELVLNAFI
jgi:hypothetical protein